MLSRIGVIKCLAKVVTLDAKMKILAPFVIAVKNAMMDVRFVILVNADVNLARLFAQLVHRL